ncbi:hypothetical protein [Nocardioides sp.]|uniref:hypothetical protein n=1 Tax=Nocardioides sp. TaxID=35761 RepID=UPI002ED56C23
MVAVWVLAVLVLHHLGPLHAQEKVLTYVVAIAPFVLLGLVVWRRHRQDSVSDPVEDDAAL